MDRGKVCGGTGVGTVDTGSQTPARKEVVAGEQQTHIRQAQDEPSNQNHCAYCSEPTARLCERIKNINNAPEGRQT